MSDEATVQTTESLIPSSRFTDLGAPSAADPGEYSFDGYTALMQEQADHEAALYAATNSTLDNVDAKSVALEEMKADPMLAEQIVVVAPEADLDGGTLSFDIAGQAVSFDAPEGGLLDRLGDAARETGAILEGVDRTNAARAASASEPLTEAEITAVANTVANREALVGGASFYQQHEYGMGTLFLNPDDTRGTTGTHELGHGASALLGANIQLDTMQEEAQADVTAMLIETKFYDPARVADASRIEAYNAAREIGSDPDHAMASDGLMKLAHRLETNPDQVLKDAGPTLVTRSAYAIEQVVATGDARTSLTDFDDMREAAEFADEVLSGNAVAVPKLERDGAVMLLNAQRGLVQTEGWGNELSQRMGVIEGANPEAFKQAREYMAENYGQQHVAPPPGGPRM